MPERPPPSTTPIAPAGGALRLVTNTDPAVRALMAPSPPNARARAARRRASGRVVIQPTFVNFPLSTSTRPTHGSLPTLLNVSLLPFSLNL
jgi:hypothetical protein